jgi:hypothetical protein
MVEQLVGIDSKALTYLIEAMEPTYDPKEDQSSLAAERIAMIRIYLYGGYVFRVLPTVMQEYNRIRTELRRIRHERTTDILLDPVPWELKADLVEPRAQQL